LPHSFDLKDLSNHARKENRASLPPAAAPSSKPPSRKRCGGADSVLFARGAAREIESDLPASDIKAFELDESTIADLQRWNEIGQVHSPILVESIRRASTKLTSMALR